jgi:hypothetical protein
MALGTAKLTERPVYSDECIASMLAGANYKIN